MPLNIPDNLPAYEILQNEGIFLMKENKAISQNIRPVRIGILNIMSNKITTETQLLRVLSNTPLQIEIELIYPKTHYTSGTPIEHLTNFYTTFNKIQNKQYDGLIITGAAISKLEFESVNYWNEMKDIFEWTKTHVTSTLFLCWASHAALFYFYGIERKRMNEKIFGVFEHRVTAPASPLVRGFDDVFYAPHSRYNDIRKEDINKFPNLEIIAHSDEVGIFAIADKNEKQIFLMGHLEYDRLTLQEEYERDWVAGLNTAIPKNYFPDNNPKLTPIVKWRSNANLLFTNWLNHYVYQKTSSI